MGKETPQALLKRADIAALREQEFHHPLNPNAVRLTRSLGDAAGLRNLGVHLVRIAAGRDTTEYHFHHHEEEFVYVLQGRGEVEIDGHRHEIAAGDFMGFAANSGAHAMCNPFAEELICLVAGQRLDFDVCEYPRRAKRLFTWHGTEQYVDIPDPDNEP